MNKTKKTTMAIIDLRDKFLPVRDQGNYLPTCTSFALASCVEFLEYSSYPKVLSPMYLYYYQREGDDGIIDTNIINVTLESGIKVLLSRGVCSEDMWQYSMRNLNTKPIDADHDAGRHIISGAEKLNTVDNMKSCLLNGFPYVMEMALFTDFDSYVSASGEFSIPDDRPSLIGTHAVVVAGYNDTTQSFIIRNTKGGSWGDSGYFYMSDEYMARNDLVFSAVRLIK